MRLLQVVVNAYVRPARAASFSTLSFVITFCKELYSFTSSFKFPYLSCVRPVNDGSRTLHEPSHIILPNWQAQDGNLE